MMMTRLRDCRYLRLRLFETEIMFIESAIRLAVARLPMSIRVTRYPILPLKSQKITRYATEKEHEWQQNESKIPHAATE
jgi:hypothetical protein